jgi:hypothetical protein
MEAARGGSERDGFGCTNAVGDWKAGLQFLFRIPTFFFPEFRRHTMFFLLCSSRNLLFDYQCADCRLKANSIGHHPFESLGTNNPLLLLGGGQNAIL